MDDKCLCCGQEVFPVYYGDDKMFQGVTYKRCMHCNMIMPYKDEAKKQE